jgi:hypothetical protein
VSAALPGASNGGVAVRVFVFDHRGGVFAAVGNLAQPEADGLSALLLLECASIRLLQSDDHGNRKERFAAGSATNDFDANQVTIMRWVLLSCSAQFHSITAAQNLLLSHFSFDQSFCH